MASIASRFAFANRFVLGPAFLGAVQTTPFGTSIQSWIQGAGFRAGDISSAGGVPGSAPAAFDSLGSFLIFWEITAQPVCILFGLVKYLPYELKGVSTATALCVVTAALSSGSVFDGVLYMAPSSVSSCWYYLLNWMGMAATPSVGPCVTLPASGAQYVAVSPTGPGGPTVLGDIKPVMSKLTKL